MVDWAGPIRERFTTKTLGGIDSIRRLDWYLFLASLEMYARRRSDLDKLLQLACAFPQRLTR